MDDRARRPLPPAPGAAQARQLTQLLAPGAEAAGCYVEFVSPGSRRQDFVDEPRRCAEGGVPYFMRVEIVRRLRSTAVEFFALDAAGGYAPVAKAVGGERLTVDAPSPIDLDPAELLP
ncbi:hypothetical protein ACIBJE_31110 [Micromonospora sp. NPDC050187]|uniref:hypothetical protein n=1 Tax=Micromonospora sp. NPDC050187 TaxID=3364277 RepID=UPI003796603F